MRKYMSKRQRPCDFCRSRKTACRIEDAPPCRSCQLHDRECTFIEAARPRKRQAAEQRVESYASQLPGAVTAASLETDTHRDIAVSQPESSLSGHVHHDVQAAISTTPSFPDMSMQFLHDLDIDGSEYQFMFRTPGSPASSPESASVSWLAASNRPDDPSDPANTLLDGLNGLNPETLGLTGDMDPYLLQRYKADDRGIFKFKQLAIHRVQRNDHPTHFLVSQPSLFSRSREEAGHKAIPESELRRELEAHIPQAMGKRLIALCQQFIAPHYPVFSTESLPDPASSPPHLLAAIYSICFPFAMYDDQLCIDLAYDSPPYEPLAHIINAAVAADLHSPTLGTVQALFLLVARSSSNPLVSDASYRWNLMGTLVSAAVNVGLHLDPHYWRISAAQTSQRRRISLCIYAMDRWLAAALGRPPHIDVANWLVTTPNVGDRHCSGLSESQWEAMLEFLTLTSVLASTLSKLYSLQAVHSLLQSPGDVAGISSDLISTLGPKPNSNRGNSGPPPNNQRTMSEVVATLGRHYTLLLISRARIWSQLYRRDTRSTWPPLTSVDHEISSRAAMEECIRGFSNFIRDLKGDDITGFWPPWCQAAFSSLCFTLLLLITSSPTVEEASSWLDMLQSTRRHLRSKASSLPVLRLGLLRVDSIFWRGVDKVLNLEPHVQDAFGALQDT
ncbi:hypothetical protein ACJZ2D_013064 [Fusarium nematophilum]